MTHNELEGHDIEKKAKELMKKYDMDPVSAHMIAIEWQRNAMLRHVLYDSEYDEPITWRFEEEMRLTGKRLSELAEAVGRLDITASAIYELAEAVRYQQS